MNYADQIRAIAPTQYDPRHVEAYMRTQHSTLDHLSPRYFRSEVRIAMSCIDEGGIEMAERIAQSFGLSA